MEKCDHCEEMRAQFDEWKNSIKLNPSKKESYNELYGFVSQIANKKIFAKLNHWYFHLKARELIKSIENKNENT